MCLGVRSKGGSLDKDEFGGIFEEIQMPLTKTELDGVFADIDKDGGGDVRTSARSIPPQERVGGERKRGGALWSPSGP